MKNYVLARPYAKAAYLYAKEKGVVPAWFDFLGALGVLFADRKTLELLKNPRLSDDILVEVLIVALPQYPSPEMQNFLRTVAQAKRLPVLPEMVECFARDWQQDRTVRHVNVTSTVTLTAAELHDLKLTLEAEWKRPVFIEPAIDESLIGGIMIQSDDYVMDGSLKGQLSRLRQSLMH